MLGGGRRKATGFFLKQGGMPEFASSGDIFGGYLRDIRGIFEGYLVDIWGIFLGIFGGYLEDIWKTFGGHVEEI